ncbi:hypothetical protein BDQ17DRAFT_1431155 [Cyathus striatus]|nr:hypothetical protein BDQ17DRAFT_1431155 [Cyathus striatus]
MSAHPSSLSPPCLSSNESVFVPQSLLHFILQVTSALYASPILLSPSSSFTRMIFICLPSPPHLICQATRVHASSSSSSSPPPHPSSDECVYVPPRRLPGCSTHVPPPLPTSSVKRREFLHPCPLPLILDVCSPFPPAPRLASDECSLSSSSPHLTCQATRVHAFPILTSPHLSSDESACVPPLLLPGCCVHVHLPLSTSSVKR